jgi:hypothetical protein
MANVMLNTTGRAVVAIAVICFCVAVIVWLVLHGQPANSLHQSALSWAWTVLLASMGALGIDAAAEKYLPLLGAKPPQP